MAAACAMLPCDAAGVAAAAHRLRAGGARGLVAFPTETVYGLGGSALCAEAVAAIFAVKGRPSTDPLIVHAADASSALALLCVRASSAAPRALFNLFFARGAVHARAPFFPFLAHRRQPACGARGGAVLRALALAFWPGPLTLVDAPAPGARLAPAVCGGSGRVGVRVPAHALARALLAAAAVPVAAPSANRFGHVSPTCAAHVVADLGAADIAVLDDAPGGGGCAVGIESTVVAVEAAAGAGAAPQLTVYRRGGVSAAQLRAALDAAGCADVALVHRAPAAAPSPSPSPGTALTHYAPDLATFLVARVAGAAGAAALDDAARTPCARAAVLDFGGLLRPLAAPPAAVLAYRDLSPAGDPAEAAAALFAALRWAEALPGADAVLLADPASVAPAPPRARATAPRADPGAAAVAGAVDADALRDRLFRAASGRVVGAVRQG